MTARDPLLSCQHLAAAPLDRGVGPPLRLTEAAPGAHLAAMDEERLLALFREEPDRSFALPELMAKAKLPEKREKELKRVLKGLTRDGALDREPGRRFRLSRAGRTLEGRVIVDRRGAPNFIADGEPKHSFGIPFLSATPFEGPRGAPPPLDEAVKALAHGDRVRAEVVQRGSRPRPYARLIELISRPQQRHMGLFREVRGVYLVELDEPPNPMAGQLHRIREVIIPPGDILGAEDGAVVEVRFERADPSGRSAPVGQVVAVLGRAGERETEMAKLLIEHGLDRSFPPEVIAQAESYGDAPTEDDMAGRRDVRDLPFMTIDGETAKDFDDAVCVLRDGKERYRLLVAIADVSHYVRIGTPLDEEALHRGTSTYLTDRAIPMLPERLSNGLCSLNPEVDRLVMLAEMSIAANGRVMDAQFSRGVIRSKARLTYTQVAAALEGEPDEATQSVLPTLLLLSSVAAKLLERRLRRGSLDLDLPEPVVEFDAAGDPTTATRRPRNAAHRLIEDLMIACNEAAARYFLERDLGSLFRIHEPPDPDRMANFAKLCLHLGLDAKVSDRPSPAEVSHLLARLSDQPRGASLHTLLLRALAAARYHSENEGHFGLASEAYLHFTSPIRRYPDLVVHRLMKQAIDGARPWYSAGRLRDLGAECSATERKAMIAERASMDLDRALVARRYLGERLPGIITGVQGFGLFIATLEPFLEGMAPVQTLPEDFYEADEFGSTLIGTRRGHRFALGDPVEVEVVNVNLNRRQVELRLLVDHADEQPSPAANRPAPAEPGKRPLGQPPVRSPSRLDPRAIARKLSGRRRLTEERTGSRRRGPRGGPKS